MMDTINFRSLLKYNWLTLFCRSPQLGGNKSPVIESVSMYDQQQQQQRAQMPSMDQQSDPSHLQDDHSENVDSGSDDVAQNQATDQVMYYEKLIVSIS